MIAHARRSTFAESPPPPFGTDKSAGFLPRKAEEDTKLLIKEIKSTLKSLSFSHCAESQKWILLFFI